MVCSNSVLTHCWSARLHGILQDWSPFFVSSMQLSLLLGSPLPSSFILIPKGVWTYSHWVDPCAQACSPSQPTPYDHREMEKHVMCIISQPINVRKSSGEFHQFFLCQPTTILTKLQCWIVAIQSYTMMTLATHLCAVWMVHGFRILDLPWYGFDNTYCIWLMFMIYHPPTPPSLHWPASSAAQGQATYVSIQQWSNVSHVPSTRVCLSAELQ